MEVLIYIVMGVLGGAMLLQCMESRVKAEGLGKVAVKDGSKEEKHEA
jgi:hypothetical protein